MRNWLAATAVVLALVAPGPADAAYLRYDITGVVTEVLMPGVTSVAVGDPWTASVYVDEAAPDLLPGLPSTGRYAPTWGVMSLGTASALLFEGFHPIFEVIDNDLVDFLLFDQYENTGSACVDGLCVTSIGLDYIDSSKASLNDSSLSGTIGLTIHDFDNLADGGPVRRGAFFVRFGNTSIQRILGLPTGLSVTVVDTIPTPAPPALWLTATGALAFTVTMSRRRKRRTADRT